MRERRLDGRRVREWVFALCTLWLVVQNLVLVTVLPWERLGVVATLAGAVLQAAWALLAPMVVGLAAAALGWAFTARMTRDPMFALDPMGKEVGHGRS
jgi:hypothetical protein